MARYSAKGIDWEQIRELALAGMTAEQLKANMGVRNYHIDEGAARIDGTGDPLPLGQLVEIRDATTGFMLIRRAVFERIITANPDLAYVTYAKTPREEAPFYFSFFDTSLDPRERTYLSEDFTFCRRWQALGGKVWLDPLINLGHLGTLEYRI